MQLAERDPRRRIITDIDDELSARADRQMLRRAIDDVLAKADAYSTPGKPISVVVATDDRAWNIEIRIVVEGASRWKSFHTSARPSSAPIEAARGTPVARASA